MIYSKMRLIPKGFAPSGKSKDLLARLASEMMHVTSLTPERREWGHWIDIPSSYGKAMFGNGRDVVCQG